METYGVCLLLQALSDRGPPRAACGYGMFAAVAHSGHRVSLVPLVCDQLLNVKQLPVFVCPR